MRHCAFLQIGLDFGSETSTLKVFLWFADTLDADIFSGLHYTSIFTTLEAIPLSRFPAVFTYREVVRGM